MKTAKKPARKSANKVTAVLMAVAGEAERLAVEAGDAGEAETALLFIEVRNMLQGMMQRAYSPMSRVFFQDLHPIANKGATYRNLLYAGHALVQVLRADGQKRGAASARMATLTGLPAKTFDREWDSEEGRKAFAYHVQIVQRAVGRPPTPDELLNNFDRTIPRLRLLLEKEKEMQAAIRKMLDADPSAYDEQLIRRTALRGFKKPKG